MTRKERFWNKVDIKDHTDCWLWTANKNCFGYGLFAWKSTRPKQYWMSAHRAAWLLRFGEIPENKFVLHTCDVRNCVNPAHLYLGTQFDNMQDCVKRKRHVSQVSPEVMKKGEQLPQSKMTNDKVKQMRELRQCGLTFDQLADNFGVSRAQAHRIVHGYNWKHI